MRKGLLLYNPAAGRYPVRRFVHGIIHPLKSAGWSMEIAETLNGTHAIQTAYLFTKMTNQQDFYSCQSSILRLRIRENSLVLWVIKVTSFAKAIDAISKSFGPTKFLRFSNSVRNRP